MIWPLPLAGRARAHHAEKALLIARLTAALTGDAGLGLRALFGTRAGAFVACLKPRNAKLFVLASRRILERDLQIVAQVRAALDASSACVRARRRTYPRSRRCRKCLRYSKSPGSNPPCSRPNALMTETVVGRPLLRIGQDRIGLGRFLEFVLRLRVVRIFVRMVLDRQAAIRLLISTSVAVRVTLKTS